MYDWRALDIMNMIPSALSNVTVITATVYKPNEADSHRYSLSTAAVSYEIFTPFGTKLFTIGRFHHCLFSQARYNGCCSRLL